MNNDDGFTNVEQSTQSLENYEDNMSNSCEWQHCGSGLTELLRQRLANSLNEELDNFRQSMDMLTKNLSL
ncbi:unnamed protein product [Auanema sp. JU1783]|nr:unnamed protein product [Auanema sp. JU1783]